MHSKPVEQTSPHELRLKRLISARKVADRYGIHLRSVARWVARGVIPPPDQILNDKRYWFLETLEAADRKNTTDAAAKAAATPSAA